MKQIYSVLLLFLCTFMFSQSEKLVFEYDTSGNQVLRKYLKANQERLLGGRSLETWVQPSQNDTYIYPNPVETELTIGWEASVSSSLLKIALVSYNGAIVENMPFTPLLGKAVINMTKKLPGVYFVKIYLSDGRIITHSLIKN